MAYTTRKFSVATSGASFGSPTNPASAIFYRWDETYHGQVVVKGTLRDDSPGDGHSVFVHVRVNNFGWSSRIYTNGSAWVNKVYSTPDGTAVNSVVVEVCVDRGTFQSDLCAWQGRSRYLS
jgi:hypothetical protein